MKSRLAVGVLLSGAVLLGAFAGAALRSGSASSPPRVRHSGPGEATTTATGGARPTVGSAREAALAYASASQQWLYLDDDGIGEAIREITTPSAADELVRQTVSELRVARDALVHATGPVWWVVRPLASRVTVDEGRAEGSVWLVTVLSAADVALPQAEWLTVDIDLAWTGGRWLLESIADRPGPTPVSGVSEEPWEPEAFDEALQGFERVGSEVSG